MPTVKRPCLHPRCKVLVSKGRCDEHQAKHDAERGTRQERGYGAPWMATRRVYLIINPLCVECRMEGQYVKATDVDHVKPWRSGRTEEERMRLFWDESNWQALCHSHHSSKTRHEMLLGVG